MYSALFHININQFDRFYRKKSKDKLVAGFPMVESYENVKLIKYYLGLLSKVSHSETQNQFTTNTMLNIL